MIATLPYLRQRFDEFNKLCFGGQLATPRLRIGSSRTMLGNVRYRKERRPFGKTRCHDFTLSISSFYDIPQELLDDTILHEMLHLCILSTGKKDDSIHGTLFRQMMDDINRRFGRHISVSHHGELARNGTARQQSVIAVAEMANGKTGVCRPSPSRIFHIHDQLPLYFRLKEVRWYNTRSAYLNGLPRSLKPKLYLVDKARLDAELADAIPLKFERGRMTAIE